MPNPDALRWDARYAAELESWLKREPRQLLQDHAHLLPARGLALDAAAGVGANSLFLAQRGLRVVALDISEYALRSARARFATQGLHLNAAVMDLTHPILLSATFDMIINFHFLERATFRAYRQALKPGGLLFFETFVKNRDDPSRPEYYLNPGELSTAFDGFKVLHHAECVLRDEAGELIRCTEQIIARKPDE